MRRECHSAGARLAAGFLQFVTQSEYAHNGRQRCGRWQEIPAIQKGPALCKSEARDATVPSTPDQVYKHDGWQGYGHWLGTGNLHTKEFLPFKKALLCARTLKLKNQKEWKDWAKTGVRRANMPSNPRTTYKHDGWQGYGNWLGTGNVRGGNGQQFLPFTKALVHAHALKLKSYKEWQDWAKSGARPVNIPSNPHRTYTHDGWQGYRHWLGAS